MAWVRELIRQKDGLRVSMFYDDHVIVTAVSLPYSMLSSTQTRESRVRAARYRLIRPRHGDQGGEGGSFRM